MSTMNCNLNKTLITSWNVIERNLALGYSIQQSQILLLTKTAYSITQKPSYHLFSEYATYVATRIAIICAKAEECTILDYSGKNKEKKISRANFIQSTAHKVEILAELIRLTEKGSVAGTIRNESSARILVDTQEKAEHFLMKSKTPQRYIVCKGVKVEDILVIARVSVTCLAIFHLIPNPEGKGYIQVQVAKKRYISVEKGFTKADVHKTKVAFMSVVECIVKNELMYEGDIKEEIANIKTEADSNDPSTMEKLKRLAYFHDPDAMYYLGDCYEHGVEVERNPENALALYKAAAEEGHEGASKKCGKLSFRLPRN